MAKKANRTKTGHKNIYYNENTKKYDVKYNFKEYSVPDGRNVYRSKWICRIDTLAQAKIQLAGLRTQGARPRDEALSLKGAFDLWRVKAASQNYSPVTIENTANFMKIIYKFIPAGTLLKHVDEDAYYRFCREIRAAGYSEETLFSLNATLRKIINHSYKRRFLTENVLCCADNLKTQQKQEHRMVTKREYGLLDAYFEKKNRRYQFLIRLLYYTGIRISEALAVTYADFEAFDARQPDLGLCAASLPGPAGGSAAGDAAAGSITAAGGAEEEYRDGIRVRIVKSYISRMKLEKDTKNHKNRTIPLSPIPAALYWQLRREHLRAGGTPEEKIFFVTYQAVNTALKRACECVGIPPVSCHDFRHTFISNLIRKNIPLSVIERVTGDTQEMILRRYSHAFESDEVLILNALRDL